MQYLIDSILMHRSMVQRTGNIWDSSMCIHCPANQQPQQQQSRSRQHLDHDDSEGPSGESAGPSGNITGRRHVTTILPATGRYRPSPCEDDKGKDYPPRKHQRTSMPANRQRRGNTSTTMDNISGISAISPAHDDEEDEPQATPPRTKRLRGAVAKKIPPTKLSQGKAFCQTATANAPDDDEEEGVADNTGGIAGRTTPDEMQKQAALARSSQFQKQASAAYQHQ